jgi:hypothetical protein
MTGHKQYIKPSSLRLILILSVIALLAYLSSGFPDSESIPKNYYYIFIMVVAGSGVLYFLYLTIRYFMTYSWNTADAQILVSEVKKIDDSESTIYESVIRYKYCVGIREYISDRIYPFKFNIKSNFESLTSKIVNKYSSRQFFKIFYNPKRPEISFIERKGITIFLICLLFFIMLFLLMLAAYTGKIEF